jgi:phospholipid/cholesterol/gamma-HCH transport system ATP-binding protein
MLYQGKLIWEGSASEVDNSDNPYVDQFVHGRSDGPIQMQVRAR